MGFEAANFGITHVKYDRSGRDIILVRFATLTSSCEVEQTIAAWFEASIKQVVNCIFAGQTYSTLPIIGGRYCRGGRVQVVVGHCGLTIGSSPNTPSNDSLQALPRL